MTAFSTTFLIVTLAGTAATGLVLFAVGWRGRRVGNAPHCRHCAYDLTGTESDRCSECGATLSDDAIVLGVRRKRPIILGAGTVLLLIGLIGAGTLGYGRAKAINWYPHLPEFALARMAKENDAQAVKEILARLKNGEFSERTSRSLVPRALEEHAAPNPAAVMRHWAELLGVCHNNGWLTDDQRDRFYGQLVTMSMQVRERVRQGDVLVWGVEWDGRVPAALNLKVACRLDRWGLATDPVKKIENEYMQVRSMPAGWSSAGGWVREFEETGVHPIRVVGTVAVFDVGAQVNQDRPIWSQSVEASALAEVLSKDEPDPIQFVDDPPVAKEIKESLQVFDVKCPPNFYCQGMIYPARPVPYNLTFDVYAVADGHEVHSGWVVWSKGTNDQSHFLGPWSYSSLDGFDPSPDEVMLELRPSREVASRSLDCYEILNHTIQLGPVPVKNE